MEQNVRQRSARPPGIRRRYFKGLCANGLWRRGGRVRLDVSSATGAEEYGGVALGFRPAHDRTRASRRQCSECNRAWIRSLVGGCVLNRPIRPAPENGLMMNIWAVAGLA